MPWKFLKVCLAPDDEGAGGGGGEAHAEADVGDAQAEGATPTESEGDGEGQGDSGEGEEGGDAGESGEAAKPKQTPWFQRRIDELTRARREAERQAQAANKQVELLQAALQGGGQTDAEKVETKAALTEAQIETKAQELAAQRAQEQAFNEACNRVYQQGKEANADFDSVLQSYTALGGLNQQFIQSALESSNPAGVLYALGKDLDEAARIMELPATRQAVEMERLAMKLAKPKPVSKAPTPIKPLGTNKASEGTKDPDKMSTAEWMEWRKKQLQGGKRG